MLSDIFNPGAPIEARSHASCDKGSSWQNQANGSVATGGVCLTFHGKDIRELYEVGVRPPPADLRPADANFMRILGQGRVSECLDPSMGLFAVDTFFRKMNWHGGLERQAAKIPADVSVLVAAYCEGVNALFRHARPLGAEAPGPHGPSPGGRRTASSSPA